MTGRISPVLPFLVAAFLIMGYFAFRMAQPEKVEEARTSLSVSDVMGGDSPEGFARALEPRTFRFPEDHGPHPEYRTEWWYLTGNLKSPEGDGFGFQFTLFRSALNPTQPSGTSAWNTNQVYMGHFAITDEAGETFRAYERFSRGAQGLAGAQAHPFRVWLEDWALEGPEAPPSDRNQLDLSGSGIFPLRLSAAEGDRGLSLSLLPEKPLVLQGDGGLSQKGPQAGNASFYYSFSRLEAEGILTLGERELQVDGSAWFDREWSTSALSEGQVGWDWFALQLTDGRDLMFYQLRLEDGSADPLSKGVLVSVDGKPVSLSSTDVTLTVNETWESPIDGTRYPSGWRLSEVKSGLDLLIRPLIPNQELDLTFRYWEGAVLVTGTDPEGPIEGRGYVELTGYSEPAGRGGSRASEVHRGR